MCVVDHGSVTHPGRHDADIVAWSGSSNRHAYLTLATPKLSPWGCRSFLCGHAALLWAAFGSLPGTVLTHNQNPFWLSSVLDRVANSFGVSPRRLVWGRWAL